MRSALRVALALACVVPARAHAQTSGPDDAPPRVGLTLGAAAGYFQRVRPQGDRGGFRAGVELLAHYRFVQAGVLVDFGGGLFGDHFTGVAGAIGARLLFGRVRVDALGLVGAHAYSGVGGRAGLFGTDDPGADGTLGFLGARVGVAYEWGRHAIFSLGLVAFVDGDLERQVVAYQYTRVACSLTCPSPPPKETIDRATTLGELHLGGMLRLNVVLGGSGP